jgi:cation transport regulator ChaC
MVAEGVFYRYQIYRYQVKEMENTALALKEARAMIATIKKERRKDKEKIQELSEIIHEHNFLLQHNDQYMLELENQLEAIAAPPPEPVILGPAEEEDVRTYKESLE